MLTGTEETRRGLGGWGGLGDQKGVPRPVRKEASRGGGGGRDPGQGKTAEEVGAREGKKEPEAPPPPRRSNMPRTRARMTLTSAGRKDKRLGPRWGLPSIREQGKKRTGNGTEKVPGPGIEEFGDMKM